MKLNSECDTEKAELTSYIRTLKNARKRVQQFSKDIGLNTKADTLEELTDDERMYMQCNFTHTDIYIYIYEYKYILVYYACR